MKSFAFTILSLKHLFANNTKKNLKKKYNEGIFLVAELLFKSLRAGGVNITISVDTPICMLILKFYI